MKQLTETKHLTAAELEVGLPEIQKSPKNHGELKLLCRRPQANEREVLQEGTLDVTEGLIGDNWKTRGSTLSEDGGPHPEMQLNIMNARAIALIAQEKNRWQLAGDQLFLDLDLSADNLPPGTQLQVGSAIIEVTAMPHLGCKKFVARFGLDAMKFVNSEIGKQMHLRGINAKVMKSGRIRVGDRAVKC